jgi:divalent metal cation (Fe/Co/Zn/Cd) transporter
VLFGIGWHGVEALVTLLAGISASSVALVGFGGDVAVEAIGGLVVLWRFSGSRTLSARSETRAQRLVAASYVAIAAYVVFDSTHSLWTGERPSASPGGVILAVLALAVMPRLRNAKTRVGERLGSSSVRREGIENMMCAYLGLTLLVGLCLNAALGWWWSDPVAGYAVAAIAAAGGRRTWQGATCCATPPGTGLLLARTDCNCNGSEACCSSCQTDDAG